MRQADGAPALAVGQRVVLFTDPVVVGHGLAVQEIARRDPAGLAEAARSLAAGAAAPAADLAGFRDLLAVRRTRQHAEQADVIVLGQVTGLREARPPRPSEHDPHYWIATLAVRRVLRGTLPGDMADVLFMNSTDVRWHTAPKPQAGETAIWLLHATSGAERDLAPWVVVHLEDRQPPHVADLLAPGRRGDGSVITLVNMIPRALSGETNQDSEANLAVNPQQPAQLVGTAFTPAASGNLAPVYLSPDGGRTWALQNILPGNGDEGTRDVTVGFGATGGVLYAGILNGVSAEMELLRSTDVTSGEPMTVLLTRPGEDQPWVVATSVLSGADAGQDRVYIGNNHVKHVTDEKLVDQPKSATVDLSLNAASAAPPAGFAPHIIEQRESDQQDGTQIRIAVHPDGTIYAVYQSWTKQTKELDVTFDVVVTRDDDWGRGDHPFRDLHDAADGKIGQRVAKDRFLHFDLSPSLGQERLGSDLTIACDPRDSSRIWLGFCDRPSGPSGTDWTLHIRFSADRGQTWSGDARTLPLTKNPSLAVDTDGRVGLLYQQLQGNRWVTNLEVTADGWATPAPIFTLHQASAAEPVIDFQPYLGDYTRLLALGRSFYGAFCGSNAPLTANFPSGVTYQRNADWEHGTLLDLSGFTTVRVSIDPFFVAWTDDPETCAISLL